MKKQTNSQKITQNRRILARRATLELSNDALKKVAGAGYTTYEITSSGDWIAGDSTDRSNY